MSPRPASTAWRRWTGAHRYHRTADGSANRCAPARSPEATDRRRCPPEVSMKFAGTVDIAAPRDRVWAFVIDPNQVGQCGPGVESIEVIDATHFKATAKVGIGFISARFLVPLG